MVVSGKGQGRCRGSNYVYKRENNVFVTFSGFIKAAHQSRYAWFETGIGLSELLGVERVLNDKDRSINKVAASFGSHCSRRYRMRHLADFLHAFAIYIYRQGDVTLSLLLDFVFFSCFSVYRLK